MSSIAADRSERRRRLYPAADRRAGRFGGLKQECGLHVPETYEERQSRDSSGL